MKIISPLALLAFLAAATPAAQAGGHISAPALAQNPAAAIGDVFAFRDPNDPSLTDLIATVRPFLVPGEVLNHAVFDPGVRYRFEVYNEHVNETSPVFLPGASAQEKAAYAKRVKPNRTIDFTFSPEQVGSAPQLNASSQPIPANLRLPLPQTVTITLSGFPGVHHPTTFTTDSAQNKLAVQKLSVGPNATPFTSQTVSDVTPGKSLTFLAGVVDDPSFIDVPAFSAFLDSIRSGAPNPGVFSRARDTCAGYNVLAIALQIPTSLLTGDTGPVIGVDFQSQRKAARLTTSNGPHDTGSYRTLDRMGNPLVTDYFVPYDLRNSYNSAAPASDVRLAFQGEIAETLSELGLAIDPSDASYTTLMNLLVARGDLLLLNTNSQNTGANSAAAYPNGRRPVDDVVDTILTYLNHQVTLGDGVSTNDLTLPTVFPYLNPPHQPRYDTSVDDLTRN